MSAPRFLGKNLAAKKVSARTLFGSEASACSQRDQVAFQVASDCSPADTPLNVSPLQRRAQSLGAGICRRRPFELGGFKLRELIFQRARETGDDRVLCLQQICSRGVKFISPEMSPAGSVDELGIDPQLIAARLQRALQHERTSRSLPIVFASTALPL